MDLLSRFFFYSIKKQRCLIWLFEASFLIFDLGVDWRYGAAHFEEYLLDYDPCSNWGNWVFWHPQEQVSSCKFLSRFV